MLHNLEFQLQGRREPAGAGQSLTFTAVSRLSNAVWICEREPWIVTTSRTAIPALGAARLDAPSRSKEVNHIVTCVNERKA